jgi:hypothetical protein
MTTAEDLRRRMEDGSLNLRGVAAALRHLENVLDGIDNAPDEAVILRLLARDVELEADAMGEAEAFLNGKAVA